MRLVTPPNSPAAAQAISVSRWLSSVPTVFWIEDSAPGASPADSRDSSFSSIASIASIWTPASAA